MINRERRSKQARPRVEPLEGRVVLSTVNPGGPLIPVTVVPGARYLFLNGSAHGSVRREPGIPDVGAIANFQGAGNLNALGHVHVTGMLQGTGFIQHGNVSGKLVLSNARGTVTLGIIGPDTGGFVAPASGTYDFSITAGTGAYAHTMGTGTINLNLGQSSFTMAFHGQPNRF